jgi:alcohol dehydrogenase class IV
MSVHHKLCHVLGGTLNLPHAETHAVVLPHAVAYNQGTVPDVMARIAAALGAADAGRGLFDLAVAVGARTSLRDLGMRESDIGRVVDLATADPYWNPRTVTREGIRALLLDAFEGRRPAA